MDSFSIFKVKLYTSKIQLGYRLKVKVPMSEVFETLTKRQFQVAPDFAAWRLDRWLCHCLKAEASRSQIQTWIQAQYVYSSKLPRLSKHHLVQTGEFYELRLPRARARNLEPVAMELQIVYEDQDLVIIHKNAGLTVHPGPNQGELKEATLAQALLHLWQVRNLWQERPKEDLRAGLVHRLDRDTEGLVLAAKHALAQEKLMRLFANRQVQKEYLAWIWGCLTPGTGRIELPLKRHPKQRLKMQVNSKGRPATTLYKVLQVQNTPQGRKFSQVKLQPLTGRTHQLRLHMASYQNTPIVGDALYSHNSLCSLKSGLLLLACRLSFIQPFSQKKIDLQIAPPQRFADFEKKLNIQL